MYLYLTIKKKQKQKKYEKKSKNTIRGGVTLKQLSHA